MSLQSEIILKDKRVQQNLRKGMISITMRKKNMSWKRNFVEEAAPYAIAKSRKKLLIVLNLITERILQRNTLASPTTSRKTIAALRQQSQSLNLK